VTNHNDIPVLSIIVPIGPTYSNESNLLLWLEKTRTLPVVVFLVFDATPAKARTNIIQFQSDVGSRNIILCESGLKNPGETRNIALRQVQTDWIAFWDADDLGDAQEALLAINEADELAEIIVGRYRIYGNPNSKNRIINFRNIDNFKSNIVDVSYSPGLWRMIFKTSEVQNLSFPSWRMAEDQAFIFLCDFPHRKLIFSNRLWYSYFTNIEGQATKSSRSLKDLKLSTEWFMAELIKADVELFNFGFVLLLRQIGSALRHGKIIEKSIILFKFLLWFGKIKPQKKKAVILISVRLVGLYK
jgi:glycosyltransferase involved in cell wall biosynthesis